MNAMRSNLAAPVRWAIAAGATLATIVFLAVASPPSIVFAVCGTAVGLFVAWVTDA